jgi:hypothetical protein
MYGRQHLLHLVKATTSRVPHIDMAMNVFSTIALLGCAFLVYACFQWLREELDLKRPAHRDRRGKIPHTTCITIKTTKQQIHRPKPGRWRGVPRFARKDNLGALGRA